MHWRQLPLRRLTVQQQVMGAHAKAPDARVPPLAPHPPHATTGALLPLTLLCRQVLACVRDATPRSCTITLMTPQPLRGAMPLQMRAAEHTLEVVAQESLQQ